MDRKTFVEEIQRMQQNNFKSYETPVLPAYEIPEEENKYLDSHKDYAYACMNVAPSMFAHKWFLVKKNLSLIKSIPICGTPVTWEEVFMWVKAWPPSQKENLLYILTEWRFIKITRDLPRFLAYPIRAWEMPYKEGLAHTLAHRLLFGNARGEYEDSMVANAVRWRLQVATRGGIMAIPLVTEKDSHKRWHMLIQCVEWQDGRDSSLMFHLCLVQAKNIKPGFTGQWSNYAWYVGLKELMKMDQVWQAYFNFRGHLVINTVEVSRNYLIHDKYGTSRITFTSGDFWRSLMRLERASIMPRTILMGTHPRAYESPVKRMSKSWLYEPRVWGLVGDFLSG